MDSMERRGFFLIKFCYKYSVFVIKGQSFVNLYLKTTFSEIQNTVVFCFILFSVIKAYEEVEVQPHIYLTVLLL